MTAELVPVTTAHPIQPGLPSVEFDLISKWLISFGSPSTRRTYAGCVRLFLAWLERIDVPLLEVQRAHVDGWVRSMEMDEPAPAPATVGLRLAAASSLFEYAMDEALIGANPCARVRRPQVSRDGTTAALDSAAARALLLSAEADGPRSLLLVSLLSLNGLRISEALNIDVEHVSSERGHCVVRITGKGGRDDVIPLPPVACRALEALGRDSGPVLLDGEHKRMGRGTAAAILARLGRLAGIGHVHPHMLRCTAITELLRTHQVQDVMAFARHSHPSTTLRYDRRAKSIDEHLAYVLGASLGGVA